MKYQCVKCGYEWQSRKENPKCCVSCKRRDWREGTDWKGNAKEETECKHELPDLLKLCETLLFVASTQDLTLSAIGKGMNMSNLPGYEGYDLLEMASNVISQHKEARHA